MLQITPDILQKQNKKSTQLHIFSELIWSLTLDHPLTLNKMEQEQ